MPVPVAAQVAFPILAIAPSVRHAGIVCLDGRLRALVARSVRVRGRGSEEELTGALARELEREVDARGPGLVIVEHGFAPGTATLTYQVAEALANHARETGVRVVRVSFAGACARITGERSAREAALVLLRRYPALAKRLAPTGTPLLRHERWREAKPLLTAFAIAHAAALEVLTTAARPLGTGSPPPP